MDIKEKVTELVQKITGDKDLLSKFKADPMGTVKGLLAGIDLDKEQLAGLVEAIKAKVNVDAVTGFVGGLFGKKD